MKTFERWLGGIVTLVAVSWPFVAVWATARQLIPSRTEYVTCILCWPASVVGPVLFWNHPKGKGMSHFLKAMVKAACCSAIALIILFVGLRNSERMFTRVLMANNSESTWQQMTSDLYSIGAETALQKQSGMIKRLPESLNRLGRRDDTSGVNVMEFGEEDFGVVVTYGGRNRKWGVMVGSAEFLNYFSLKNYKYIPVSTNAVFFVGTDW